MRLMAVSLWSALLAGAASGQTAIRRPQAKGFPLAVTASAGMGFGAVRATYFDDIECASPEGCYEYGTGSGWQAGVDFQIPLGRTLGFEIGGQMGRPSLKQCLRGQCGTVDRTWAIRGSGTLLWRFKPSAPVYFGLGGVYAYFSPGGPVLPFQTGVSVSEFGATTVIGLDLPIDDRVGGRIVWRGSFMIPSNKGLPETGTLRSVAWDNALSFGLRLPLGR